jgi:hypothetical protein
MNHSQHPDDSALTRELRDSLSELATPARPPLAAITSRGRAHQRRRLAGFAGLAGTGAAVSTALALSLAGVLGAAPARSTIAIRPAAPARGTTGGTGGTGTIQTAAFTLTSNANGTDTLTLTHSQMFNPAALQQALAQHGIPAMVRTDAYCLSIPAAPDPLSTGVVSLRPPAKPLYRATRVSGDLQPTATNWVFEHTETVIDPAAMPSGTELFFGYSSSGHALLINLIYTSSYTCSTGQPHMAP